MKELLNDQQSINAAMLIAFICIVLILIKISTVQDAIKDGIDDLLKK